MSKVKAVTFFGYAGAHQGDVNWDNAYEIARQLALKDYKIIDGGGPGIMQAATEGAESVVGADTTAVYYRPKSSTMFEGAAPTNVTDHQMYYADYVARTLKLLELGDVYMIFNGGTGTFSEFGMAWGLARLYYGHHKPLILVGTFWHEIMDAIVKNMNIREEEKKIFYIANNVHEAMLIFNALVAEINQRESFKATEEEAKFTV